jgi:toxin ParE1/3/4
MFQLRPAARRDIEAYVDYLNEQAGPTVADRFIDQGRATFASLAVAPELGPLVYTTNAKLNGLRKWCIKGFPKMLIFYVPLTTEIRIIRVLHTAQDWWSLLDSE